MQKKVKYITKRIWSSMIAFIACLTGFCLFFPSPVEAADITAKKIKSAQEMTQVIQKQWEEAYFESMTLQINSNYMQMDGQDTTFTSTFAVDRAVMKEAVASEKNLEEFLESQEDKTGKIYEIEEGQEGSYQIKAPFQTKRIVVYATNMKDYFGASQGYVYEKGGETILCFSTEAATEAAYHKIRDTYGANNCYVDQVISVKDGLQSLEEKEGNVCYSWGAQAMGMDILKRQEAEFTHKNPVVVAVVDTGLTIGSDIFRGKTIHEKSYNFADGNADIEDAIGHGTHVAGILADLTPDNVQLLILKVARDNGSSTSLIMSLALDYAVDCNADVINMSYASISQEAEKYTFLDNAIDTAYEKGIPLCVSAGNITPGIDGRDIACCYPACNPQTICVTALDESMELASYSFYGKGVDFAAPGSNIVSAGIHSNTSRQSGTSMAAPHIAAAMVYMKLYNPKLSVEGLSLELKKVSKDLGEKGKDAMYGYGCPNISNLMDMGLSYDKWTVSAMLATPVIQRCVSDKKGNLLAWKKVKKAQGYMVFRCMDGDQYQQIAKLDHKTLQYIDETAEDGKAYTYYVRAFGKRDGIICYSGKSVFLQQFTLLPVSINKVKAVGKKKIAVLRKSQKLWQGKMLQVQYSPSKVFKNAVTKTVKASNKAVVITPKKKGTVYIRLRAKYSWNNKRYYSVWSRTKKIKVK